jgi:hypothetical protein
MHFPRHHCLLASLDLCFGCPSSPEVQKCAVCMLIKPLDQAHRTAREHMQAKAPIKSALDHGLPRSPTDVGWKSMQ